MLAHACPRRRYAYPRLRITIVQIVAFDNQTQRRRLHGHTISFPHAPQRFSSVKLTFRPARAITDERRRKEVVEWLACRVGVAVAVVCLGDCSDDAHGLQLPVTIGPLPTSMAETVGDKLRACTADLAEVVKRFGVPLVAVEEPRLENRQWTFSEAVLYAAGTRPPNRKGMFACTAAHMSAALMMHAWQSMLWRSSSWGPGCVRRGWTVAPCRSSRRMGI